MPIGFPNGQQYQDEFEMQSDKNWTAPILNTERWMENKDRDMEINPYQDRSLEQDLDMIEKGVDVGFTPVADVRPATEPKKQSSFSYMEAGVNALGKIKDAAKQFAQYDRQLTEDIMNLPWSATEPENLANFYEVLTGQGSKDRFQTWPEKAVTETAEAAKKLFMKEVDPTSPEGIAAVTQVAQAMVLGPAAPAKLGVKLADGTLGSFAGVKANLPKDKMNKAAEMISKGENDPDKLWEATGFFKGTDGQLRYEIPDSGATMKIISDNMLSFNNPRKLSEVMEHPELYKAYPELADLKIRLDPSLKPGNAYFAAWMDDGKGMITVSPTTLRDASVILHEAQHWIQKKEGFANGGARAKDEDIRYRFSEDVRDLRTEQMSLRMKESERDLTPAELDRWDQIQHILNLDKKRREVGTDVARQNYRALAGETEARNVELRYQDLPVMMEFREASKAFKDAGYSLDIEYGRGGGARGWSSVGGPDVYKLRKWGTTEKVDPEDLPPELKRVWDAVSHGTKPSKYPPWLTEDVPAKDQAVFFNSQIAGPYGYGYEGMGIPRP